MILIRINIGDRKQEFALICPFLSLTSKKAKKPLVNIAVATIIGGVQSFLQGEKIATFPIALFDESKPY
jgi:hypothetical protein